MKMAKKFLAVALAGVLALSVLTGCGDSTNTKSIAEAMSDMGQVTDGLTFKEDTKLNTKAKKIVEVLADDVIAELDHEDLTDEQKETIMTIMESYNEKFVWVSVTETKGNSATAQALNLIDNLTYVHGPKGKEYAKTWYIGTTTVTRDGTTYRFAVFTAEAQTPDGGDKVEKK